VNVDPFDSRLAEPEERARLARVFERELTTVVGYALPLTPIAAVAPKGTSTKVPGAGGPPGKSSGGAR